MLVSHQLKSLIRFAGLCSVAPQFRASLVLVVAALAGMGSASAQVVRTKKNDRGVYRPPVISADVETQLAKPLPTPEAESGSGLAELIRGNARRTLENSTMFENARRTSSAPVPDQPDQPRGGPLYETQVEMAVGDRHATIPNSFANDERHAGVDVDEPNQAYSGLQRVNHNEVVLKRPRRTNLETEQATWAEPQEIWEGHGNVVHNTGSGIFDPNCGCEGNYCDSGCINNRFSSLGCDPLACDSPGCDSLACDGCDSCCPQGSRRIPNGRVCFNRNEWFGSVEVLLMFRDGIRLPNLVTTGPSADSGTAGEIGQTATQFLVGSNANAFDDMSVGGRLTLGTWLDSQRCRSLVARGWFGGRNTVDFNTTNSETPVIVRPFFNVTDGQTAAQDNNLIAFPGRSNGAITVNADSNVCGGDISVRQFWTGGLGASIDVLYGYQYMGLDESLSISTSSVAIAVPNTPVGTVQAVTDSFSADNQFHGGQFGVALRYEENCWTFNGLLKTGFGSLRRTANLSGQTTTTVGVDVEPSNEGFLVQSTNSGQRSDSTFGWVPELDLSLGWHRYPRFDVTAGYHLVAMTDALRVFDTVDPNLAINSANNPTGQQRPTVVVDYGTYFVHGIHFGLQYRY